MRAAPIAMIQKYIQQLFCDRFAPLLTAYVEGGLNDKQRTKVTEHINTCAACRQEVEQLTELGKLLRANPPAVPLLKPDLWIRIQAEITAEPERPLAQPVPQRQPVPGFQWSSFGVSFATAGTLVAAGVVGVVVLSQSLIHNAADTELPMKKSATTLAIAPADREPIVLTFRPVVKPGPEPAAKMAVVAPAQPAATEIRPSQPVRRAQVAIVHRYSRRSNRPVTVAAVPPTRSIPVPTKFHRVAMANKREQVDTLIAEPEAPALSVETVETNSEVASKPVTVAMALPEPTEVGTMDAVVAPREVPATGFVNDSVKLRARQILFVYSGR